MRNGRDMDILLLDIEMGEMSGVKLARHLRRAVDKGMDSVGAGIVGMSYNWLRLWNCGKPCLQPVGKLLFLFHRL